jgi:hypothetical protein
MPKSAVTTEDQQQERKDLASILYKPLPHSAGTSFSNEVYVPLFQPSLWKLFNPTPEMANNLGLVPENPLKPLTPEESEIFTFHFKVPVHKIDNFVRNDGSTGFATVVCPAQMNQYLVEVLGRRPMFRDSFCPFCAARSKAWDDHNERWKEVEQVTGIKRKDLSSDGYKEKVKSDPILGATYNRAKSFQVEERYVVNIFDYSAAFGQAITGEPVSYKVWFAPKTVFNFMYTLFEEDHKSGIEPFFSGSNPQGMQLLKVIKDTSRCNANNFRDTRYTLMKGGFWQVDENWKNYLTSLETMADPSDLIMVISTNVMNQYVNPVSMNQNSYTQQAPQTAPMAPPAMAPPQQAPMVPPTAPQMAPPTMAPPVPQTAPMAPPQQAPMVPPTAPQTAPMAPPAMAPPQQAPVSPQMAPPAMAPPQQAPVSPQMAPPAMAPPQQAPMAPPAMAAPAQAPMVPSTAPSENVSVSESFLPPGMNRSW